MQKLWNYRATIAFGISVLLLVGMAGLTQEIAGPRQETIQISPQQLVLDVPQGGYVCVHVEIPYSSVITDSLTLEGVPVDWSKADDCGDLVAFFVEDDIEAKVSPPEATLEFAGYYNDGTSFQMWDTVKVK